MPRRRSQKRGGHGERVDANLGAPRSRYPRAALVRAVIVAALLGFAAGWLVHLWTGGSPEAAAHDFVRKLRERGVR